MTPRNWGLRECLVAVCLGLVAAGGLVGLLVWNRSAFMLATAWGCTLWLAYRVPNRNLLAELEATQMRLSAYNASDSRADLAEAPLTPPGGVELYDQDTEPVQLDPIYPRLCICCGQPQHYGSCPPDALAARAAEAADAIVPLDAAHIGQACVWPDDQGQLCAAPAVGWVPWHDGDAAWLCGPHYTHVMELAEDDASDGPRSLPRID